MTGQDIVLTSSLFQLSPDGQFQKVEGHEPVYAVKLGDIEAALPLKSICREFKISADSNDGKMLALIARALTFISPLKIGDTLPTEVLTGEPSWKITNDHRQRAYFRLAIQLSTWLNGEERVFTSADELMQIAEDPSAKKRWNEAFDEAARRLGFTENGREQVVDLLMGISKELAYIEALRDQFDGLKAISEKLDRLAILYARENSIREIVDSVRRLYLIAIGQFTSSFDQCDAQTGEILSVLKNPSRQTAFIRSARDDLYCRLFAWNTLIARWQKLPLKMCEDHVAILRDTYHFLALRFAPSIDWPLMSKLLESKGKAMKTEMVW